MTNPTAQAYAELQLAFDHYNRELFAGELPPCLITMQREKRSYGYFSSERFVHHHDKSKTDEIASVIKREIEQYSVAQAPQPPSALVPRLPAWVPGFSDPAPMQWGIW